MSDADEPPTAGVGIWDPETGQIFNWAMSAPQVWHWDEIIRQFGIEAAVAMFVEVVRSISGELTNAQHEQVRGVMRGIHLYSQSAGSKDEAALQMSYRMLSERRWTRKQAARFASWMLSKEIETDTWRKRLDKYVQDHSLPRIDLPSGRSRSRKI